MVDLSVIILSYNTKKMTRKCLNTLRDAIDSSLLKYEIIVVDNGSTDGTWEMLNEIQKTNSTIKIIRNKVNEGYPKGNNQGIQTAQGKYLLLLNSDVLIESVDFKKIIKFLEKDEKTAALTVKVVLPSGKIDPASHRGFPTIWNSFSYFSRLERLTAKIPLLNRIFGGYHLTYRDLRKIHEIDSPAGAFYFIKRKVFDEAGWFDEDFFMYGEDLDLSYRIKKRGYKIVYFPFGKVLHLKWASGLKTQSYAVRLKTSEYFYQAMRIFYEKHYARSYPRIVNRIVYYFIDLKKHLS